MFMPIAAQQDSTRVKHRGTKSENRHHGKHIDKELQLDEVVVVAGGVSRVKKSAFNTIAVDTKEMQNTTKNLSDALSKAPGLKLRESQLPCRLYRCHVAPNWLLAMVQTQACSHCSSPLVCYYLSRLKCGFERRELSSWVGSNFLSVTRHLEKFFFLCTSSPFIN